MRTARSRRAGHIAFDNPRRDRIVEAVCATRDPAVESDPLTMEPPGRRAGSRRGAGGVDPVEAVAIALRGVLGCWFVLSGGIKLFGTGLDRFTRDVANYRIVGPPLDAVAAYSVPWVELVAGGCLMLGLLRRGAILTLAGLVCVFAFCIGWAWFHQLDISCGCHGGEEKIRYWNKLAEFLGYYAVLGWLWWAERTAPRRHLAGGGPIVPPRNHSIG